MKLMLSALSLSHSNGFLALGGLSPWLTDREGLSVPNLRRVYLLPIFPAKSLEAFDGPSLGHVPIPGPRGCCGLPPLKWVRHRGTTWAKSREGCPKGTENPITGEVNGS